MRNLTIDIAAVLTAFFCLLWLHDAYDAALRDARILSGWTLGAAMAFQLLLRLKNARPGWLAGRAQLWTRLHICMGCFAVLTFALHCNWSLPDTAAEWALSALFFTVALSGLLGAYLNRSIPFKLEQRSGREAVAAIPVIRSEIARTAASLALNSIEQSGSIIISDLYVNRLHDFFQRPQNIFAHLRNSRQPVRQIHFLLQSVERDLDESGQRTLTEMRRLVEEKDNLDFQHAHEVALKAWLFAHVPATYALIVWSILHMAVIYAFTSGAR